MGTKREEGLKSMNAHTNLTCNNVDCLTSIIKIGRGYEFFLKTLQ